jgi:CBS domain-containing protein
MAVSQTEIESQVVDLSEEAFETFCNDLAGMFGIEIEASQQEICEGNIQSIKKRFNKLVAVNTVDSEGILNGSFQLIFDQEGMFTLGGVIIMLPEARILENRKRGTIEDNAAMLDSIGEVGNLLVGSWDRVYRENLEGHGHFVQRLPAFIGKPWLKPKEIGLSKDDELIFVPYEMKVEPFPAFHSGVIFPKSLFEVKPEEELEAKPEEEQSTEEIVEEKPEQDAVETEEKESASAEELPKPAEEVPAEPEKQEQAKADEETEQEQEEQEQTEPGEQVGEPVETAEKDEQNQSGKPRKEPPVCRKCSEKHFHFEPCPQAKTEVAESEPETATEEVQSEESQSPESEPEKATEEVQAAASPEPESEPEKVTEEVQAEASSESQPVSETIQKISSSPAVLPGEHKSVSLAVCAGDIMDTDVVWASSDDSIQEALNRMQQHDVGYMLVGKDGVVEGIVSRSDITGAVSPYLKPIFAKWRRPLDDATLQIKLRWIITRPVRTISLKTPLMTIFENMTRFGGRSLPVINEQGKIEGIVTVFSIFRAFL